MTVRCPRCGTLYERPARARLGAGTTFRCARCRHIFDTRPAEPTALSADASLEADDDGPEFTFGDEEVLEVPPPKPPPRAAAPEPARSGAMPARFALRALFTVTLGYAILSVYLYTHPDRTAQLLGRLPVLGAPLVETRLSPASILLADVRGDYRRVKGEQLVFVISGTAVNNASVAVRGIQVEGKIRASEELRKVVFCGAAPRDVQDLSLREIALLQTLEPPKDWALAPGEQASFVIVFPGPPPDLKDFAAEVVAVRTPQRGAGGLVAGGPRPSGP